MNSHDKNTAEPIRLQVFLAHCGVASRRACEKIITDGRVSVNGQVVMELGTKVGGKDKVCVDGNLGKSSLDHRRRGMALF